MKGDQPQIRKARMDETLALYSRAHRWLVIPIIVILVAFWPFYFSTITTEPFAYHVHIWLAIAWYMLMVTQPYLATHGRIKDHRLWGMLGLIIAGGFIASGLLITPVNVFLGASDGGIPGVSGAFFYGITLTETLTMVGFAVSVAMAIIKARKPDEHAIWMLGTVFFGFMPAWLRISVIPILVLGLEMTPP